MANFHLEINNFLSTILRDIELEKFDEKTVIHRSQSEKFCIISSSLNSSPITDKTVNDRKKTILDYQKTQYDTLVIWEDQWISKNKIIESRLKSKLQKNRSTFARQCEVVNISKPEAKLFLEANHLLGFLKAKYYLGLIHKGNLTAIATFGPIRTMTESQRSTSSELIQFVTLPQTSVIGGLSKLIKHFYKRNKVGDLMTYIPLEWSSGASFQRIGFKTLDTTPPLLFFSQMGKRKKNKETPNCFDLGNFKMLLTFESPED